MDTIRLTGLDEAASSQLGKRLAKGLFPGAFIAFFGDLGAGKTTLTTAIASELGIDGIQSPTFTIVREYSGQLPLFHFDAYRLGSADELYDIGFDDYVERNGVIIMEWCENVPEALPANRLEIHISGSGCEPRNMELIAFGKDHERICKDIV